MGRKPLVLKRKGKSPFAPKAAPEVVVRILLFAGWINHQVKKKVTVDKKQAKLAWDHTQSRASGKSSSARLLIWSVVSCKVLTAFCESCELANRGSSGSRMLKGRLEGSQKGLCKKRR